MTQRESGVSAVGPESKVEALGDAGEGTRRRQQLGPGRHEVRRRVVVGQQDADLLERLPDRRDVGRQGGLGVEVAAEREGGVGGRDRRAGGEPRVRIAGVDPTAREHLHVGREGHRRRPVGEQDLGTVAARPQQDDRGRRPRLDRRRRHGRTEDPSRATRACASVTGSSHTKSRQT